MNVVVRLAHRGDAPTLAALQREAAIAGYRDIFPEEAEPPTLEELLAQWHLWLDPDPPRGRTAFVAEHDTIVMGVVLAGPDPGEPNCGHFARLYVRPDRWGTGIGTALYSQAMAHLREVGFSDATLWVLEHNLRARNWYRAPRLAPNRRAQSRVCGSADR